MADEIKLSFGDWLKGQPESVKKLPYQQQQESYSAYSTAFDKAKGAAVLDKARSAVSPASVLKSIMPNVTPTAAPATTSVASPNLNVVDQARQGLTDVDMSKKSPELINQLATFGGTNKEQFLRDWQAAKAAVAAFTPEAARNDPEGAASAQQKYEMYNTAANKLRYDYPIVQNNFMDRTKQTLADALNPEIGGGVKPVPVPVQADTGAAAPPRPAPAKTAIDVDGPLPKEIKPKKAEVENLGFDWDKVKETAKGLGTSILGVLNAAIAGRTAAMQGRTLDWDADTFMGREEARRADEAKTLQAQDWQAQLAAIDRDFTAEQAQLQREYEAAMQSAKTEEDRQKVAAEFAQRDKEQRIAGQQQLAAIAASRQSTKPATGGFMVAADPLGIMGMGSK